MKSYVEERMDKSKLGFANASIAEGLRGKLSEPILQVQHIFCTWGSLPQNLTREMVMFQEADTNRKGDKE